MKIDPRHLEILAAIVEHGGLTEGADALGKSQPSVSRSLSQLEARLGMPLFEKGRRPLKATEFGLALAAKGRTILEAGNSASSIVSGFKRGRAGVVRVGGTPIFMDGVISAMIAEFQMGFPDIRIDQAHDYLSTLLRQMDAGSLDLAICPMNTQAIPTGFEFVEILPGRNVIACATTHPLAHRSAVTLADITPFSWITPPTESPLYEDLRSVLSQLGMREFKVGFTGGSLTSVVNILERSNALTVLPYSVVFALRRKNTVSALPIKIGHPDRNLGIVWKANTQERPSVRRFRHYIENEFKTLSFTIQKHEQTSLWRG